MKLNQRKAQFEKDVDTELHRNASFSGMEKLQRERTVVLQLLYQQQPVGLNSRPSWPL